MENTWQFHHLPMSYEKRRVYHTPHWYREHCHAENGGSPMFRKMLKNDMAYIGADNDSNLCYEEKIGIYEETWNRIKSNWRTEDPNGIYTTEMAKAEEREFLKSYKKENPQVAVDETPKAGGAVKDAAREELRRRMKLGRRYFDDHTT